MDIDIKSSEGTFKLRACGVIVRDDKMLVDRARNFEGYVYLGGHVGLGENSKDAIIREAKEELQIDVEIVKLICINENLYPIHNHIAQEVSFYYLLKPLQDLPCEDFERHEIDGGIPVTHHYSWVNINDAKEVNLRPYWVADMVMRGCENYYHLTDQRREDE